MPSGEQANISLDHVFAWWRLSQGMTLARLSEADSAQRLATCYVVLLFLAVGLLHRRFTNSAAGTEACNTIQLDIAGLVHS